MAENESRRGNSVLAQICKYNHVIYYINKNCRLCIT